MCHFILTHLGLCPKIQAYRSKNFKKIFFYHYFIHFFTIFARSALTHSHSVISIQFTTWLTLSKMGNNTLLYKNEYPKEIAYGENQRSRMQSRRNLYSCCEAEIKNPHVSDVSTSFPAASTTRLSCSSPHPEVGRRPMGGKNHGNLKENEAFRQKSVIFVTS